VSRRALLLNFCVIRIDYKAGINKRLEVKRVGCLIAVATVLALTSFGHAADNPPKKSGPLPPLKLQDYSLEFKGNRNTDLAPGSPPGLNGLVKETNQPFLGLSFTRPLSK
jgi:hypothetical protein